MLSFLLSNLSSYNIKLKFYIFLSMVLTHLIFPLCWTWVYVIFVPCYVVVWFLIFFLCLSCVLGCYSQFITFALITIPISTIQPKILKTVTNKMSLVRAYPLTHYKSMFWTYNNKRLWFGSKKRFWTTWLHMMWWRLAKTST
jgi:hypothetical protein